MEFFDLEIIIPITNEGKYKKRLEGFKKIGFFNHENHSMLLTLLIGTEEKSVFLEGWPSEIVIKTVPSKLNHPACKVYDYFSKMTEEHINNIDWFMKIDDDSSNNIDALINDLNEFYDVNEPIYAVTKIMQDVHPIEQRLLEEAGFDYLFKGTCKLQHEHEGCVLSRAAMHKIISNENCMQVLKKRSLIEDGHTDQCIGAVARMVKIHPVKAVFMSSCDNSVDFSLFGGHLHHIHPVEKGDKLYYLIENKIEKNCVFNETFDLVKNKFYFFNKKTYWGTECCSIFLNEKGCIVVNKGYMEEKIWLINDKKLEFLDSGLTSKISFDLSGQQEGKIHVAGELTCGNDDKYKCVLSSDLTINN